MLIPVFACGYSSLLCWFQLRANYKTLEYTLHPKAWQGQLLPTQQQRPRTRVHAFKIASCCLSTFFFITAITTTTTNCRGSTDGGKQTTTGLFIHSFLTWILSPLNLGMQSLDFHSWDVLWNHPPLWLQHWPLSWLTICKHQIRLQLAPKIWTRNYFAASWTKP